MNRAEFYPYATAGGAIALSLDAPRVEIPVESNGDLRLFEIDTAEITVRASVAIPADLYEEVFSPEERDSPPAEVRIVLRSIESRTRSTWLLEGDGIYEHMLDLRRDDWSGMVEIQAVLTRSTTSSSVPEAYASEKGNLLAWSEIRRILFDAPPPPPSEYLPARWADFEAVAWLRPFANNLFALSIEDSQPELLLNQRIPGAVSVLESKAMRGPEARIRNATYYMIAHQVWSSLIASVLDRLASLAHDGEPDLGDLLSWERGVVREWAPLLLHEEPRDQATSILLERIGQAGFRQELLIVRLPTAIQAHVRTFRGFEGLVREVDRL